MLNNTSKMRIFYFFLLVQQIFLTSSHDPFLSTHFSPFGTGPFFSPLYRAQLSGLDYFMLSNLNPMSNPFSSFFPNFSSSFPNLSSPLQPESAMRRKMLENMVKDAQKPSDDKTSISDAKTS